MKKLLLLSIILFFTIFSACRRKPDDGKIISPSMKGATLKPATVNDTDIPDTEVIELFTDSLHIGEKGRCMVELIKHRVYGDEFVIIKFYRKGRNRYKDPEAWLLSNTYSYETNSLFELTPDISDFNNDGFNDLTYISAEAARGSNEVRRLFIYDDEKKELISMVNSQSYPNMRYNKELDCIDAFLVYGGCSTVFLKIEGDSLHKFAKVECVP